MLERKLRRRRYMTLYQELKKALTGSEKDIQLPKNWTPNNVRAIVVTRAGIVLYYFTKMPKIVRLNIQEIEQDIAKNGSTGSLQNVLNKRQLSCLEEIYVDSVFKNYKGSFNLENYVDSLVSSSSRLRYFGYIDFNMLETVYSGYQNAFYNDVKSYIYALDKGKKGVEIYSTNNSKWFEKYNLRPAEYSADSPTGNLALCLRVIEKQERVKYDEIQAKSKHEVRAMAYKTLVSRDISHGVAVTLLLLRSILRRNYVNGIDEDICEYLQNHPTSANVRITEKDLLTTAKMLNIHPGNKVFRDYIYVLRHWSYIKDNLIVNEEELVEIAEKGKGILDLEKYYKSMFKYVIQKRKYSVISFILPLKNITGRSFKSLEEILNYVDSEGDIDTLASVLLSAAGYTYDSLMQRRGEEWR